MTHMEQCREEIRTVLKKYDATLSIEPWPSTGFSPPVPYISLDNTFSKLHVPREEFDLGSYFCYDSKGNKV